MSIELQDLTQQLALNTENLLPRCTPAAQKVGQLPWWRCRRGGGAGHSGVSIRLAADPPHARLVSRLPPMVSTCGRKVGDEPTE